MPLIEELPVTTTQRTTQGWAYVPDIKPQLQPLDRKRGAARNQAASKGDISAKQRKAIQIKLNELDKENYKDTTIPIPAKTKEKAGKKITPNVRRILTYQRTFAHYLADEEAQLTQNGNSVTVPTLLPQTPTLARSGSSRGSKSKQTPMQPPPRPGSARKAPASTSTPILKRERSTSMSSSVSTPSASQPMKLTISTTPQTQAQPEPQPTVASTDNLSPSLQNSPPFSASAITTTDPLLRTRPHLKPPSTALLTQLLSEPPLSYSASRAQPLEDHLSNTKNNDRTVSTPKPARYFCSICGYWGKIKCKRCGERTCGLMECWRGHEGVCSVPEY